MKDQRIILFTGISGVGKTSLLELLQAKYNKENISFSYFDSEEGIPSFKEVERDYGDWEQWKVISNQKWITRVLNDFANKEIIILDRQSDIEIAYQTFTDLGVSNFDIYLLCADEKDILVRLGARGQEELYTEDMKKWSEYLYQQAKVRNLTIINPVIPLGSASRILPSRFFYTCGACIKRLRGKFENLGFRLYSENTRIGYIYDRRTCT